MRKKIKSENLDIYAQLETKYKALGKMANEKEKDAYLIANIERTNWWLLKTNYTWYRQR